METDNINVNDFLPAKNPIKLKNVKRRAVSESGDTMEVEEHNGIQGKAKHTRPRAKRSKKNAEPNESKVNMRKIPVPAHRYNLKIYNLFTYYFYPKIVFVGTLCI